MAEEERRLSLSPEGSLPRKKRRGADDGDGDEEEQATFSQIVVSCFMCGDEGEDEQVICPRCGLEFVREAGSPLQSLCCPNCRTGIPIPQAVVCEKRSESALSRVGKTVLEKAASAQRYLCRRCRAPETPTASPLHQQGAPPAGFQPSTSGASSKPAARRCSSLEPQPSASGVCWVGMHGTPEKPPRRRYRSGSGSQSASTPESLKPELQKTLPGPEPPEIAPCKELALKVSSQESDDSGTAAVVQQPISATRKKGSKTVTVRVDVHHPPEEPSPAHHPSPQLPQAQDDDEEPEEPSPAHHPTQQLQAQDDEPEHEEMERDSSEGDEMQ